jgi:hypothetical protein
LDLIPISIIGERSEIERSRYPTSSAARLPTPHFDKRHERAKSRKTMARERNKIFANGGAQIARATPSAYI